MIFNRPLSSTLGLGRFSGYVNRPGGLSRGIENFVEAAPWRGTELRASYTYTNSDRSVPSRGLQPEYVAPKHLFGFNLNQRYRSFAFNFDLNRTGAYVAPIFENDFPFRTAEPTSSGYTKADLCGSYERRVAEGRTMVLFVGADNIFNQRYYKNWVPCAWDSGPRRGHSQVLVFQISVVDVCSKIHHSDTENMEDAGSLIQITLPKSRPEISNGHRAEKIQVAKLKALGAIALLIEPVLAT